MGVPRLIAPLKMFLLKLGAGWVVPLLVVRALNASLTAVSSNSHVDDAKRNRYASLMPRIFITDLWA